MTVHEQVVKRATVSRAEKLEVSTDRGVVLRLFAGGRNFEAATNDLDGLDALAASLRAEVERAVLDDDAPSYTPSPWESEDRETLHPLISAQLPREIDSETEVHFGVPVEMDPADTDIVDLVDRARGIRDDLDARVAANGDTLLNASVHLAQSVATTVFVDRYRNMSQSLVLTTARVFAYAASHQYYGDGVGGLGGFELAHFDDAAMDRVATMPFALTNAERLKPGRYPIITAPELTGVMAHEAFGHTQEGDTRMLGRSCATALEATQEQVGAPGATIISNPAVFSTNADKHGCNGSFFFDDEGQLARPHVILDEGRVGSPMNSLINAVYGDQNGVAPRRSNGRRESWRRPLFSRQSNTYFTPGDKTLDELIAMVDHGYVAEWASGGMEDPKGMRLTASTHYLREIRNGVLTGRLFVGPLGGHVDLAGPVPMILKSLVAKSKTTEGAVPKLHLGGCMKYHKEYVPAGIGGPWVLWSGIQCG